MMLATPWALLLAVPLVVLALYRWRRRGPRAALAVADASPALAAAAAGGSWRMRTRHAPLLLRLLAVLLLVLAAARPQRGLAVTTLPEEGIDIALALDISGSMNQSVGSGTTRLAAAQAVIEDFVEGLTGDRLGLVVFRAQPLVLSPLTLDHDALLRSVEDASDVHALPDGTAIGLGLAEAVNLLRDSPALSRVVVLLTDGQNNAGEVEPLQAARLAEALAVRVYTVGFQGADSIGERVDAETLALAAETTGGEFYLATTEQALRDAYTSIGALERSRVGERRFTEFQEFAPWLAGAALALLLVEQGSRSFVWRRYP